MPWIVDGTEISDEEYEQLLRDEELARNQAAALLSRLTDSYRELTQFMEANPGIVQPVQSNTEQMQQAIYQQLRQNLQRADASPRCCWIKEDGTGCRSPRMKTSRHCFAHMQMREAEAKKFRLPAAEDANGIQMAIMEVQRALIDDKISEKKAGLLLYSLQIASTNLERTTFGQKPEEMVTDFVYDNEETPPAEARKHGERQERPGDLVIGTSEKQVFTAEARRRGKGRELPLIETETDSEDMGKILPRGALGSQESQVQIASGA